jgi:hypothetical protein
MSTVEYDELKYLEALDTKEFIYEHPRSHGMVFAFWSIHVWRTPVTPVMHHDTDELVE